MDINEQQRDRQMQIWAMVHRVRGCAAPYDQQALALRAERRAITAGGLNMAVLTSETAHRLVSDAGIDPWAGKDAKARAVTVGRN